MIAPPRGIDEQIIALRREVSQLCDLATGDDGGGLPDDHPLRRRARTRCAALIAVLGKVAP